MLSKKRLAPFICKLSLQPFMQKLHLFALTGMNYGNANTLDHECTGEKKALEYIRTKLAEKKQTVIFDVGANTGNYALMLSELLKEKELTIYAFEPSKHSFTDLIKNTAGVPCVQAFNTGLGNAEETVKLYANYEGSGAASIYNSAFEQYSFNRNVLEIVKLQTIDSFCKNNSITSIDFLKIDVEGHELAVLQGGMEMMNSKKIKFIQFEFGPFHVHSKTFFKDFWDLLSPVYKIFRIISNGLFEIKFYSENLEIFRTANFLAELKNE